MFWCFVSLWVDWRQLTEIRANLGPSCSLSLSLTFTHVGSRTWPSLRQRHTESYFKSIKSRQICFLPSPWFSFELATGSVNWFKLLNYSLRQQARPTGIIASVCPKTSFEKFKAQDCQSLKKIYFWLIMVNNHNKNNILKNRQMFHLQVVADLGEIPIFSCFLKGASQIELVICTIHDVTSTAWANTRRIALACNCRQGLIFGILSLPLLIIPKVNLKTKISDFSCCDSTWHQNKSWPSPAQQALLPTSQSQLDSDLNPSTSLYCICLLSGFGHLPPHHCSRTNKP